MEALRNIATANNIPLVDSDRIFYNRYIYRVSLYMYRYSFPELMHVPTVDIWGYRADSDLNISFVQTLRRYAAKNDGRVRREATSVFYYTNSVEDVQRVVDYVNRINRNHNQEEPMGRISLQSINQFPGTELEKNIHYRKRRLPHGRFQYKILGNRMRKEEYWDWLAWAKQYDTIKLPKNPYLRLYGTWSGDPIGYVENTSTLQMCQFKLGSNINKIIEYRIKDETDESTTT